MKRFGQLLIVALFATAAWTTSANAAPVLYDNCKVDRAGIVAPDVIVVRVSDLSSQAAFTDLWIAGFTLISKEMLAAALTAISLGNRVMCYVDLTTNPQAILRLYTTATPLP